MCEHLKIFGQTDCPLSMSGHGHKSLLLLVHLSLSMGAIHSTVSDL